MSYVILAGATSRQLGLVDTFNDWISSTWIAWILYGWLLTLPGAVFGWLAAFAASKRKHMQILSSAQ